MTAAVDGAMVDSVERLFADLADETRDEKFERPEGEDLNDAWSRVEEAGIPWLLVPQNLGGFGGSWRDLQAVSHRAAFHTLPLPIGETALVCGLLARAGVDPVAGLASLASSSTGVLRGDPASGHGTFSGELLGVPWGRIARHVLIELMPSDSFRQYVLVETKQNASLCRGANIAGEPRDSLVLSAAPATLLHLKTHSLFAWGALLRVAQTGGTLERALDLCVRHVGERTQFGRRLGEFQAIQQQLAVLAEEAAAVTCAAMAASDAVELGETGFEIAAAKLRANLAIARGTSIAHQCHGAIGFTREHLLHRSTRRLWSWRSEFGNDAYWARWLGEHVQSCARNGLWAFLTERSDRLSSE
jgi:acyl-CoA dehydrogenase